MMKLYIDELRLSPYTYSVLGGLQEKRLSFELTPVRFENGKCFDPEFSKLSPTELIPFLIDGNLKLSESLAMLEYLDEKYPEHPILPQKMEDRAHARMLLSWYRCGMTGLRNERSTETVFYEEKRTKTPLTANTQQEVKELTTFLKLFLKPGAQYLFGEWTIADHETALMLQRLIRNGDPLDPDLKTYANRIWERPSAKDWVEFKRKPHVSYY